MLSARHTYTVRHRDEVIGTAVVRMMHAAEFEACDFKRVTNAQVRDVLAERVESTTITIDGDAYPDGHAERVEWWGRLRGPYGDIVHAVFAQCAGLDEDLPDPKS